MRLEGSLDAFSLPDIFQLLSFTKKTGGLHLRRADLHGVVYVTTGSLTGGASDVRRQALARRLVGTGSVDGAALERAVGEVTASGELGVARALQQAGAVDEAVLHELAGEHVVDTVFDLLRWPEGDFAFVMDEVNPDDVGVSLSVEEAVAEARRRLEGWASVSTTIPSPDSVLTVALTPPDDTGVSRDEWALLALVDGRRTVSQVVAATGRGEYAVVSALASLVDRGLLAVTADGQPTSIAILLDRLAALSALEGTAPELPDTDPADEPAAADPEPSTSEFAAAAAAAADALSAVSTPAQREDPEPLDTRPRAESSVATEEEFVNEVVPPRAEPFMPRRRPDHPDEDMSVTATMSSPVSQPVVGQIDGTAAVAAEPATALIERDPSVNKSLLLRLIAGVRGL